MLVSEWPYFSHSSPSLQLSCSRCGFIATSSGSLFAVYQKTPEKGIIPISSAKKCENIITCISWCSTSESEGAIPLRLFLGTENGQGYIFDIPTFSIISCFTISEYSISSVEWSNIHANLFFVGLANGDIISLSLVKSTESDSDLSVVVNWIVSGDFPVEQLHADQNSNHKLIASSKIGQFATYSEIYSNSPSKTITGSLDQNSANEDNKTSNSEQNNSAVNYLTQCGFHPHISDTFYFITASKIYFGFLKEKTTISIFPSISFPQIIGAFFPSSDENAIIVVMFSSILLLHFTLDKGWRKIDEIQHFKGNAINCCSFDDGSDRYVIMTKGNNLYIVKFYKNKLFVTDLMRNLERKPSKIAINSTFCAFIVNDRFLYLAPQLTCMTELKYCFDLKINNISQIEWVSDTDLIVSSTKNDNENGLRQKLYFFSLKNRALYSILKPQFEMMIFSTNEKNDENHSLMKFIIQNDPNKKYFAVVVANSLAQIFRINDSRLDSKPVEDISLIMLNEPGAVLFASNNNLKILYKTYSEDFQLEPFKITSAAPYSHHEFKSSPSIARSVTSTMLIICLENGDIFTSVLENEFKFKNIGKLSEPNFIKMSDDNSTSIIIGKNEVACVRYDLNRDKAKVTIPKMKIKRVDYVSNSAILVNIHSAHCFSFRSITDFKPIETPHINQNESQSSFGEFIQKVGETCDIEKVILIAIECRLFYIEDLLRCVSPKKFEPRCYGINMEKEKLNVHLNCLSSLYEDSHSNLINRREVITKILCHDKINAFSKLLTIDQNSENFVKNVMKAALSSTKLNEDNFQLMMSSLFKGKKNVSDEDDITDLLFYVGKYDEAAKRFVENDEIDNAALTLKLLGEENDDVDEIVDLIKEKFIYKNCKHQIVPFLLGMRRFEEAAEILYNNGEINSSNIIKSLKLSKDGKILFDSSQLLVKLM